LTRNGKHCKSIHVCRRVTEDQVSDVLQGKIQKKVKSRLVFELIALYLDLAFIVGCRLPKL
jgi:hypothetical protein